ncbi:MAG TPA: hypothetical protein VFM51_07125 [Solirubrobacterales bacterium]|nr:hypothetical protein [Solirubrobacterales bacterium]
MRRRFAISALIALLVLTWQGASRAEMTIEDGLRVTFNADFAPHSLPRLDPAPVEVEIHGRIATVDGSHPPPLRWLEISLHRNGRLYTKGLSTCSAPSLQSTSSRTALARCGPARIGRGSFRAEVALGSNVAATGRVLAFNSRRRGEPAALLHLFASVPVRFTLVVPLTIARREQGRFGTILRARIPRLGGGLGSVTEIDLEVGRRYAFGGKRRSYLSAACAAPAGLPGAVFTFARGSFRFEGHRAIESEVIRDCWVR